MNERIKVLTEQAGIQLPEDTAHNSHIYRNSLERFAQLIIKECLACCGSQADKNNLLKHFGLPVESNVEYQAPPVHNSITSQYTRKYNIPRNEE